MNVDPTLLNDLWTHCWLVYTGVGPPIANNR